METDSYVYSIRYEVRDAGWERSQSEALVELKNIFFGAKLLKFLISLCCVLWLVPRLMRGGLF